MTRIEKPAAALQPFVRYYVHVEGRFEGQAVDQPVPARTTPCIEFTFGDPYEVWSHDRSRHETAHPVAVIGAQTFRRVHLAMQGQVETFVIVFQPGGLSRLFAVPANVLTNQHFEGRAVLGGSVDALRCRLGESASFVERVRVVDNHLLLLLGRIAQSPPGAVIAAARELLGGRGRFRVAVLAKRAGLSPRQFERRFVSEMGMSPKIFGRIARFEMALHCKMHSPGLRWAEIAHDLGYHDQMHMVHDFQQLSGAAPSEVAPRLELFVPREVTAAATPRATSRQVVRSAREPSGTLSRSAGISVMAPVALRRAPVRRTGDDRHQVSRGEGRATNRARTVCS